jgi:hypothetical protein
MRRKDETNHDHYRTQASILQVSDALGEAMQSGQPYQTPLNPPPADPACCHPPRSKLARVFRSMPGKFSQLVGMF